MFNSQWNYFNYKLFFLKIVTRALIVIIRHWFGHCYVEFASSPCSCVGYLWVLLHVRLSHDSKLAWFECESVWFVSQTCNLLPVAAPCLLANNNCCRLYFTYFSMKMTNNNKNKQIRLHPFNVTKLCSKPANWSTSQMQTISTVRTSVDYGCIEPLNFSCISSTGNHKQWQYFKCNKQVVGCDCINVK